MRGKSPIAFVVENNGNVNSTEAATATFTSKPVGSGSGRKIILLCTCEDATTAAAEVTTCTVDGNACTRRVEHSKGLSSKSNHTAIFTLTLTSESGNVSIVLGSGNTPDSWGLSYVVVTGMQSEVPTDSAVGDSTTSPIATSSTLDGVAGGIAVGVTSVSQEAAAHTWGSSMTKQADQSTGGGADDHAHSAAFDLLPNGRVASTETVSATGSIDRFAISTACFR